MNFFYYSIMSLFSSILNKFVIEWLRSSTGSCRQVYKSVLSIVRELDSIDNQCVV